MKAKSHRLRASVWLSAIAASGGCGLVLGYGDYDTSTDDASSSNGAGAQAGSGTGGGIASTGTGVGGGSGGSGGSTCPGATPATGAYRWSQRFGDAEEQAVQGIAADGDGVTIVGTAAGMVHFNGGAPPISSPGLQLYLAKLTPAAGLGVWAKTFSGTGYTFGDGIAADGKGGVAISGGFETSVLLGTTEFMNTSGSATYDVFVARFSANGIHYWSHAIPGTANSGSHAVAVDASEDVLMAADFTGQIESGGMTYISDGQEDILLSKYKDNNVHQFSKTFGDGDRQLVSGIAATSAGALVATGTFRGTLDFGVGPLTAAGDDVFLVKLDATGAHVWSGAYGGAGDQLGAGVATNASGVYIVGTFSETIELADVHRSDGNADVFVAKLDLQGNPLWSRQFGGVEADEGRRIAVDDAGNVVITGEFRGEFDFGNGTYASAGLRDIFVLKLDPCGNLLWSKQIGNALDNAYEALAVDKTGKVYVGGRFEGTIDFGGGPLTSAGSTDIFVVAYEP
jgi:hypothetical protein